MGWKDLEPQGSEEAQATRAQAVEAQKVLDRCARSAFATDAQKPLRQWLRKVALSGSYSANASATDVAYKEGTRALAVKLLKMGGCDE